MAKSKDKSPVEDAAATAAEAAAAVGKLRKRADPLTNENQTHVDQGRFCVKPKSPDEEEYFTDSTANAYTKACEGYEVIDHHRGNSRYRGPVVE